MNAYPFFEQGTEYILVDSINGVFWLPTPLESKSLRRALPGLMENESYGILAAVDGIWLLKKGYSGSQIDLPLSNGLKAKFYHGLDAGGELAFEEILFKLDRTWNEYSPVARVNENFSIIMEGYLHSAESGDYIFQSKGNGTMRVYIGKRLVFENNSYSEISSKRVFLAEGYHKITLEYVKGGMPAIFKLYWRPPWTNSMDIIPPNYLHLFPS